jgi:hypothetical protein
MSIWWSIGQLLVSLIAWPLIANFSCPLNTASCRRSENMGWRYLLFALGGLTLFLWGLRFLLFPLLESPRFLVGIGKDAEAVAVIQKMAEFNGKSCSLTIGDLEIAARDAALKEEGNSGRRKVLSDSSKFTIDHVKALFATRKMAWSTSLLIALWGVIGLASTLYNSFLPYLLTSRGAVFGDGSLNITYRNQVILSIIGVPGAFLAGFAVERPNIGRKGTLAIASGELSHTFYGYIIQRPLAKDRAHWGFPLRNNHCPEFECPARVELRLRFLQ